ncbi:MAG: ribosome silencing factor [Lentisphaeria bacterium]|jgi:ribosome-associated protein
MAEPKTKTKKPALDSHDTEAVARFCAEVCHDHKAEAVMVFDARKAAATSLADYYVVCTATSDPHLRALKNHLEKELAAAGVPLLFVSGTPESRWVVVNFSGILVHLFHSDLRHYYKVEELWEEHPVIYRSPDCA